jgi:hypothetical protein
MALAFSALSLAVLFLSLLGLLLCFCRRGYPAADALVFAIVVLFGTYSAIFQTLFLTGWFRYSLLVDVVLAAFSLSYVIRHRLTLLEAVGRAGGSCRRFANILCPFGLIFLYLFFQAVLLPPAEYDAMTHNLARVLLMMQEGSLFLEHYTTFNQAGFFVGADILHFLFLRWPSDWGLGIFSFLSYTAILLATFGLVRLHLADDKLAVVTALVIGSLVELVLQATGTKNDIPLTAMAAATFLAASHLLNRRDPLSLALLATTLVLGSNMKVYFLGFSLPFAVFFLLAYGGRWRSLEWASLKWTWPVFLLPGLLVFHLGLFMTVNHLTYGTVFGTPQCLRWHRNPDGWAGGLINASRYLVQTLGLPRQLGGEVLEGWHSAWLGSAREAGKAPQTLQIAKDWPLTLSLFKPPLETWSWYGPLGFFLCLPAVGYGLLRGSTFIRVTAASLLCFAAAVCWQIGWMPWNNRFFSLFFGGSGLCVGFLLKEGFKRRGEGLVLAAAWLCLAYAALGNYYRPFLNLRQAGLWLHRHVMPLAEMTGKGDGDPRFYRYPVFSWVDFVTNRDRYALRYYRDERLEVYTRRLRPGARVLLVADEFAWIFPYLFTRPDVRMTLTTPERLPQLGLGASADPGGAANLRERFDYVLVANIPPPAFLDPNRLIYRRESKWRDERGELGGEPCFLYDYTSSGP